MQTHYFTRHLPVGIGSQACWAIQPSGKGLVFVHGFGGTPVGTWLDFPALLQAEPACRNSDLLFFGYDSLHTRAAATAYSLRQFLDELLTDPSAIINSSLGEDEFRGPGFRYEAITLIAHSLGAVVARQALVDAHRAGQTWTSRTRLVLFAPAHKGAIIEALVPAALTNGLMLLSLTPIRALHSRFITLLDLRRDSPTLASLEAHTTREITRGKAEDLIARKVIFGSKEAVVDLVVFAEDPPSDFISDRSHTDVCKPSPGYSDPISHLLQTI